MSSTVRSSCGVQGPVLQGQRSVSNSKSEVVDGVVTQTAPDSPILHQSATQRHRAAVYRHIEKKKAQ